MDKIKAFDVPSQSKNPKIAYVFYKTGPYMTFLSPASSAEQALAHTFA
jgi:hypothetical protein